MIYLFAKYTFFFALTALLGILLGYWLARRNTKDVTECFEDSGNADESPDAAQWDRLWTHLNALHVQKETDLSGVYERIENVSDVVAGLPKPQPVNFDTIEVRLDSLEARIKAFPIPLTPAAVDLSPVTTKLDALEQRMHYLSRSVAPTQREESHRVARKEPRILKAALYGAKDNLQSISGVGPKLENLLNQNGVYYFWQVAEWSKQDIEIIDERLDVFQGRIERDDWVSQAQQLKNQPGAANMPAE